MEDGRCKLGLAGRLRARSADRAGCDVEGRRGGARRRTGDGASLVASLASGVVRPSGFRSSCLRTRSSRPISCPWPLAAEEERAILRGAPRTNLGPARLAGICRRPRSTIWKVLWRHGVSRRRRSAPRQSFRRYEWAQPGALLHMDTKHLPRFSRPGHWAHGDRSGHGHHGPGTSYAALRRRRPQPACLRRAARRRLRPSRGRHARGARSPGSREQGCAPLEAVMTDNALIYTRSRAFKPALADHQARHITIPPFTPRWNGKVERFIQTLEQEWAKSRTWPNHQAPRPRPDILPALLQPPPTTHLTRRPATDQPRSPPPQAGQLAAAATRGRARARRGRPADGHSHA